MTNPIAAHDYNPGGLETTLEFLKRTRSELRELHRVRVWKDHVWIIDVNKDFFEVRGIGYQDGDIIPLLQFVNTAFNRDTIHNVIEAEYKEFGTGRRWAWAADRVL
jgi:hypothetical protein